MSKPACFLRTALSCLAVLLLVLPAFALEPPRPGEIEKLRSQGKLAQAQARAKAFGNYIPKVPLRGTAALASNPQDLAEQIAASIGSSLDAKSSSQIRQASTAELGFMQLDLNYDRTVDERDILALGFTRPKTAARMPSLGTHYAFALQLDFPDYPRYYHPEDIDYRLFDQGDTDVNYRSLQYFYDQASYGQLHIEGSVYSFTAPHPRAYYHPNDDNGYGTDETRRVEAVEGAILAADAAGADFSRYDNDGDGSADYFLVIYTGPVGAWASYWWGYYGLSLPADFVVDGINFTGGYSWQWEQWYPFGGTPSNPANWDPYVTIHETGHALGLPDYYDYDGSVGPGGGLGGLDQMDGNWGDHNSFSKYILGWYNPTVAFTNLNDELLSRSFMVGDAVIFTPGFDPVCPWSEFFIAQNRWLGGLDASYPTSGMLIWHVDARVGGDGGFLYDNSYASHKLLRLMEADGQEEIEMGWGANAGDFYQPGQTFTPTSTPNSNLYDGSNPGIRCQDIQPGPAMTADFLLYSSNPPSVNITAPAAGATVSGNAVTVTVTATDDGTLDHVQLLIDGVLVKTWNSFTSPQSYTWNSLVDFNGTRTITARAWDDGNQAGSASISVTVNNAGLSSISDDFEAGLNKWRAYGPALESRGIYTEWDTRISPDMDGKLSSGLEAWVKPATMNAWYGCNDYLRSQRIDATGYTHPLLLSFDYRSRDGMELYLSNDNGSSWKLLERIAASGGWAHYATHMHVNGDTLYLMLRYAGSIYGDDNNGIGANLDNVSIAQLASDPPTVTITSPADGATVSGDLNAVASASDDTGVANVKFYLNGGEVADDNAAPYTYTRDTTGDDNHPHIVLKAIAFDINGTPSDPAQITIAIKNPKPFPVSDDFEDSGMWSTWNWDPTPDWTWVDDVARSGSHSYGWVLGGGGDGSNWEGLWYNGITDLASNLAVSPTLKVYYKGDLPTGGHVNAYMYNSWVGYIYLGEWNADQADWFNEKIPLDAYLGYSGQITFWVGNDNIDGTGVWLDDFRVENFGPTLTQVAPERALAGTTLTFTGSDFGSSRGASTVTFDGLAAQNSDYVSWSNTSVQVKIPAGAVSGPATVNVDGVASDAIRVAVILPPPNLGGLGQQ